MVDHTHLRTERLVLTRPTDTDLADLHSLHSDPRVWQHLPAGRHTGQQQTRALLHQVQACWAEHGLGSWVVRLPAHGTDESSGARGASAHNETHQGLLVGLAGCSMRHGVAWNLAYRLHRQHWGRGYAQEVITAARAAAAQVRPDLAVTAYLLEHNAGSRRAVERAGMVLVWRGPDAGNPDPHAVRLVYADRPVDAAALALLALAH